MKLKSDKMIHDDDGQFYISTRFPKLVSALSHNSQKLLVSTRYTPEKSHGLHDRLVQSIELDFIFSWKQVTLEYLSY